MWAARSGGLAQLTGGTAVVGPNAIDLHYHGQPDWLYSTDGTDVFVNDLPSCAATRLWGSGDGLPQGGNWARGTEGSRVFWASPSLGTKQGSSAQFYIDVPAGGALLTFDYKGFRGQSSGDQFRLTVDDTAVVALGNSTTVSTWTPVSMLLGPGTHRIGGYVFRNQNYSNAWAQISNARLTPVNTLTLTAGSTSTVTFEDLTTVPWAFSGRAHHVAADGTTPYLRSVPTATSTTQSFGWSFDTSAATTTASAEVMVSSPGNGAHRFHVVVDGVVQHNLYGELGWTTLPITISGPGTHTLEFRYVKSSQTYSSGQDMGAVRSIVINDAG